MNTKNMSRVEHITFYSNVLEKMMSILVYLPQSQNNISPLPVLYFFHGRNGDENIMTEIGLNIKADQMIVNQEISPMIIACPRIENSRGINSSLNRGEVLDSFNRIINIGRYEDYFIEEVVPLIDKAFNTIKNRKGRFIGGVSAGGYAALHQAFRHQDMFSKAGGHMPAIELRLEEEDKPYFAKAETWEKYDPVNISQNNHILPDFEIFLDAGDNDEGKFYEGCSVLHKALIAKNIKSQNHVSPGNHSVEYIKANIEHYLKFYGS